jgi:hypothetical protein
MWGWQVAGIQSIRNSSKIYLDKVRWVGLAMTELLDGQLLTGTISIH